MSNQYLHVEAAAKGSPQKQFELAKRLAGRPAPYAMSAAIHWLEHASQSGHSEAGAMLAQIRSLLQQETSCKPQ